MSFETDLHTRLSQDGGISALVSTRLFPALAPQGTARPYCVYTVVSKPHIYSHSGFSGLSKIKVQVSCYGDSYQQAKNVANAVISALETWPGSQGSQSAFCTNQQDVYETETGLYRIPIEFQIIYNEL